MYGMIHKAARELVLQAHGEAVWDRVAAAANIQDDHLISGEHYDDAVTLAAINAISEEIRTPVPELLEVFGEYWIGFTGTTAYASFLDMSGDDLPSFLENLDRLHTSVKATMPQADMPSFQVLRSTAAEIEVLYASNREGLETFVKGLLKGLLARFGETGEVVFSEAADGVRFIIQRNTSAQAAA